MTNDKYILNSGAMKCLGRVNDLKQLNPNNRDDVIEIRLYSEFDEKGQQ